MAQNNNLELVTLLGENEEKPKKGRTLLDNFKTSINYILGFMIKPLETNSKLSNILHFSHVQSGYGSKIPSLDLKENSFQINLQYDSLKKLANSIKTNTVLKKNVNYFVEIKVIKDEMSLYINGNLQSKIIIGYDRYELNNVKVYLSNPSYEPSNVLISNVIYIRLKSINAYMVQYYDRQFKTFIKKDLTKNKNLNLTSGLILSSGMQNNVGLKITGYIKPTLTGSYKFRIAINDGARLYINNKLVINKWSEQAGVKNYDSSPSYHTKDLLFNFSIDWFNNNGTYSLVLYWLQPGFKVWQIIPKENFLFSI